MQAIQCYQSAQVYFIPYKEKGHGSFLEPQNFNKGHV